MTSTRKMTKFERWTPALITITVRDGKHMAINVKTHGMHFSSVAGETEKMRELAWDEMVENFWGAANDIAVAHGYKGVYAEGRSGGWCVPYTADGYPNPTSKTEQRRFVAFQKDIRALLADMPDEFTYQLAQFVESIQADAERENATERALYSYCAL